MVLPNMVAGSRRPPHRRYATSVVAGVAAALSLLPAGTVEAADPVAGDRSAASAVRALTTSEATDAAPMPGDFADIAGYRPALTEGLLVAPQGSCSSPVPLPVEFDTACKAHDLGYDLLRYADHSGHPLGAWARRDLDGVFTDRIRMACTDRHEPLARTRCAAMAEVAAVVVDLNSRRQSYGVPVVERFAFADNATTWLSRIGPPAALIAAALLGYLVAVRLRLSTGAIGRRAGFPFAPSPREVPCTH